MSSVRDITVDDIVDRDPTTINIGQTLSKVRNKIEDHNLRVVPITDGKKFRGMLSYRELMENMRSDPSKTKIESLVHQTPEIDEDDNLVQLCTLSINSGRKMFALVGEHDRLEGAVGEREIVYNAADADEIKGLKVADLMTDDVITIGEDESHDTARNMMHDHNVSRLPVVDEDGVMTGIITFNDLLGSMVTRDQMSEGDLKAHKESLSDIPVSEVMHLAEEFDAAILEDGDTRLKDAIQTMKQENKLECVITANDKPIGILTLKDVINHISTYAETEALHVNLTGPEVPQEKQAIHDKVETAINGGLGRLLERPEELKIHMKKYEKDGKRHKYSLNFTLISGMGQTTINSHGWSLLDAVDEGLEQLETVVKKEKEKTRDEARDRERRGKYS